MSRRKRIDRKNQHASVEEQNSEGDLQQALEQAVTQHGEGNLVEAETAYLHILNTIPEHPIALHYLGVLMFQRDEHSDAKQMIEQALSIAPDYADAHHNLGKVLHELGNFNGASESYALALEYDPESAETHNFLGLTYEAMGALEQAIKSFEAALTLQPDYLDALNNLGNSLRILKRSKEAIDVFQKAIDIVKPKIQRILLECNDKVAGLIQPSVDEIVGLCIDADLAYKRNIMGESQDSESAQKATLFVDELQRFWDINLTNVFRRDKDIRVADSVLHIFRIKDNIENFNKKALYILIREMTGSNTQHITRIINVMKKYNKRLQHEFDKYGMVDVSHTGSLVND